jgi:ribonucleotide monophosphatase NagD (HAD superfamily)
MIGDNIDTDIEGAYNYGWKSVLVTTGVSKHNTHKANHMCSNLEKAV